MLGSVSSAKKEKIFLLGSLIVSAGNYLFNIILAKLLIPDVFADIAFLVTLLLGISFLAMTLQLTATKIISGINIAYTNEIHRLSNISILIGLILALLFYILSPNISDYFSIENIDALHVFSLVFPFYFLSSINRGLWQGQHKFDQLALSYQLEMWLRLLGSLFIILFTDMTPVLGISIVLLASVIISLIPLQSLSLPMWSIGLSSIGFGGFLINTLVYELSQVLINNSDILLVKHYFDNFEAGVYASLALVGRMIYYFSWMFIMLLVPKILKASKDGKDTSKLLFQNCLVIGSFATVVTLISYFWGSQIITIIFNKNYISAAPLLWQYSIATSFFAIANIFTYYFLSFEKFLPVYFTLIIAFFQIIGIALFHDTLEVVVRIQILLMGLLLIIQILYFWSQNNKVRSVLTNA